MGIYANQQFQETWKEAIPDHQKLQWLPII